MSGIKVETREVAGYSVTVTQHAVLRQAVLQVRLGKIVSGMAGSMGMPRLLAGIVAGGEQAALQMLPLVFAELQESEVVPLIGEILRNTFAVQQTDTGPAKHEFTTPEAINGAFAGDLLTLYRVLWFALEVNYRDFFSGVAKLAAVGGEKKASPST